jgi:hypothetical protein
LSLEFFSEDLTRDSVQDSHVDLMLDYEGAIIDGQSQSVDDSIGAAVDV